MLWTVDYGSGRVFVTALGHDADALKSPGFISTFARGAEWAATNAVTVPLGSELVK
jgi:type 1 glutamine amidotransferase